MTRWFEDIDQGSSWPLGSYTFSEEEIIRFGKLYDPQYFHTDPDTAYHAHFDGLIASGWHTVCIGHKLMVDALHSEADRLRAEGHEPGVAGPSPGVNRMDFMVPVRPGDTVSYTLTITAKRPSKSLKGWGVLTQIIEAKNQDDETVYRSELVGFSKMRDYKPTFGELVALKALAIPGIGKLLRR